MKTVTLDLNKDVVPKITINVKYTGIRKLKIKLWLAKLLIKLAIGITGLGIKFENDAFYNSDL